VLRQEENTKVTSLIARHVEVTMRDWIFVVQKLMVLTQIQLVLVMESVKKLHHRVRMVTIAIINQCQLEIAHKEQKSNVLRLAESTEGTVQVVTVLIHLFGCVIQCVL